MSEWTMFHNPRCSKSRQTLELLNGRDVQPQIIEYLKETPTLSMLREVVEKLGIQASELLRKKEAVFKELNLDLSNDEAVLQAMIDHPVLMERPVVIRNNKAVLGRPPENVLELF